MNQVVTVGNISTDITLSYTPNTQTAVAKFNVALNRPRRQGEEQGADFPRFVAWGNRAESISQYCQKGTKVAIQGHLTTGSYKDRDGKTVYTTEVTVDNIEFISGTKPREATREEPTIYEDVPFQQVAEEIPF